MLDKLLLNLLGVEVRELGRGEDRSDVCEDLMPPQLVFQVTLHYLLQLTTFLVHILTHAVAETHTHVERNTEVN